MFVTAHWLNMPNCAVFLSWKQACDNFLVLQRPRLQMSRSCLFSVENWKEKQSSCTKKKIVSFLHNPSQTTIFGVFDHASESLSSVGVEKISDFCQRSNSKVVSPGVDSLEQVQSDDHTSSTVQGDSSQWNLCRRAAREHMRKRPAWSKVTRRASVQSVSPGIFVL